MALPDQLVNNRDIDSAQAQEWLRFNEAAGPQRLRALAQWVTHTEGPLDELDSSMESLDVVWAWFLDFMAADFAGLIPADYESDRGVAFHDVPENDPLAYAAEVLAEYVLEVIRQSNPDAAWALYPHEKHVGPMLFENEVGVSTGDDWLFVHAWTGNLAARAKRGVAQALSPSRLREIVSKHLTKARGTAPSQPHFRLRNALDFAGPVVSPPRFVPPTPSPSLARKQAKPKTSAPSASEQMDNIALIHASGDWDDEGGLPPIEETDVAALLQQLHLVEPPQDLTSKLRDKHLQLHALAGKLLVETYTADGRLRSVAFECLNADAATWDQLRRRLQAFTSKNSVQAVRADDGIPLEI